MAFSSVTCSYGEIHMLWMSADTYYQHLLVGSLHSSVPIYMIDSGYPCNGHGGYDPLQRLQRRYAEIGRHCTGTEGHLLAKLESDVLVFSLIVWEKE
jgi:hypothetical protein